MQFKKIILLSAKPVLGPRTIRSVPRSTAKLVSIIVEHLNGLGDSRGHFPLEMLDSSLPELSVRYTAPTVILTLRTLSSRKQRLIRVLAWS